MHPPLPRHHRRRALAGLTVCLLGTAASTAHAGSVEQLNRLSGPQGAGAFTRDTTVLGASDTGRYGLFTSFDYGTTATGTYVRDIVGNVTTALTAFPERVLGTNAAETLLLVTRPTTDDRTLFAVRPVGGGPETVVYTTSEGDRFSDPTATISGDGRTVALAVGDLKLVTVATGAVRSFPIELARVGPGSLSDDGSVVAGGTRNTAGFKITSGVVTQFDRPAVVSANGSTIVRYGASEQGGRTDQVIVERSTGGGRKTFAIPGGGGYLGWVAPDGSSAVVTGAGLATQQAQRITFATGRWSAFGGAFSESLDADLTGFNTGPGSVISRNGRYAAITYGNRLAEQAALVDLTGGDLPGDQEALTASSYVQVGPAVSTCGKDASQFVVFGQPASWLPVPRRAELSIVADGKTLFANSSSTPYVLADFSTFTQPIEVKVPAATASLAIAAKVVDDQGRTVTTTETTRPFCIPGFPL